MLKDILILAAITILVNIVYAVTFWALAPGQKMYGIGSTIALILLSLVVFYAIKKVK